MPPFGLRFCISPPSQERTKLLIPPFAAAAETGPAQAGASPRANFLVVPLSTRQNRSSAAAARGPWLQAEEGGGCHFPFTRSRHCSVRRNVPLLRGPGSTVLAELPLDGVQLTSKAALGGKWEGLPMLDAAPLAPGLHCGAPTWATGRNRPPGDKRFRGRGMEKGKARGHLAQVSRLPTATGNAHTHTHTPLTTQLSGAGGNPHPAFGSLRDPSIHPSIHKAIPTCAGRSRLAGLCCVQRRFCCLQG